MQLIPSTTLAGAIVGGDLHTAVVNVSPLGVRAKVRAVLHGFREMPTDVARRTLGEVPEGASIVLVIPSSMVGVRPTALPADRWAAAREEILKSIESLFPFPASEAAAGCVGRRLPGGESAGYIIAADRRQLRPWMEALQKVVGRPVDSVVSSHMALLGLGLQQEANAEVLEWSGAGWSAHRLAWGEISELNGSMSDVLSGRIALPSDRPAPSGARAISGADLAAAGALASVIAPGTLAPLIGRSVGSSRRWVPAAAAIGLGCLLLWGAGRIEEWRYERGIAHLERARAEQQSARARVESSQARTNELVARLDAASKAFGAPSAGMLSALEAAQAAVPEGAFLYRVEVDGKTVTVKGEAKRAGDVLRALEDSPAFRGARELDTPVTVEERGLEMFNIRVEREPSGGGA
jgi:hypothetical protein